MILLYIGKKTIVITYKKNIKIGLVIICEHVYYWYSG